MQTTVSERYANDPRAQVAGSILRKCVHCGFCLATCPTYNLLGDELDSPRGRIYLVKQLIEGHEPTRTTQQHLDRCLTCRNCETTCPSGVEYGHLVDAGRELTEERVERPAKQRLLRWLVSCVLPYPARIGPLVRTGQRLRAVLPRAIRHSVPIRREAGAWPSRRQPRRMLILDGCVQPSMAPCTNTATARVFDALGISLTSVAEAGCCGAVQFHLSQTEAAKVQMRRNIDAWWPAIEAGAEAIIVAASGCGVTVKDYGHILADDPDYADKACRVGELARDPVEVLLAEDLSAFHACAHEVGIVAFHPPCTLQHGQRLPGLTERLLRALGFELAPIPDAHVCCGSAGTYSIFQPGLSRQLRDNKVRSVMTTRPNVVATANIGCQLHLGAGLLDDGQEVPVVHWIELVDELISKLFSEPNAPQGKH